MPKKAKAIILTIIIVLLGFFREYLFYNINWIYKTLTANRPNSARKEFYFLLDWSPSEILILKWILTILFFSAFLALTYWIIKLLFNNKRFNQIILLFFGALLMVSGGIYILNLLIPKAGILYGVSRTLMGIGQSFMPLMFFYIIFKFLPQIEKDSK